MIKLFKNEDWAQPESFTLPKRAQLLYQIDMYLSRFFYLFLRFFIFRQNQPNLLTDQITTKAIIAKTHAVTVSANTTIEEILKNLLRLNLATIKNTTDGIERINKAAVNIIP